jgi:MoaA/NifB/PqqE/SkfB family radical SAM enzyme
VFNFIDLSKKTNPLPSIELEISTRCPVQCPLCPRTKEIASKENWNNGFMDYSVLTHFIKNCIVKKLLLVGGYGDPIYHPKFIEIINYLTIHRPELPVLVETNGSYKDISWWERLGKVSAKNHVFSFSIDGLADTNHKYRINSDWESIINGIKELRKNHPGPIEWKWILFSYNQHQVVEGFRFAKDLGIDSFKLVDSNRHTPDTKPTLEFNAVKESLEKEIIAYLKR